MDGPVIVISLFVCSANAMNCVDRSPKHTFSDPETYASAVEVEIEALVSGSSDDQLVLARCRYLLREKLANGNGAAGGY